MLAHRLFFLLKKLSFQSNPRYACSFQFLCSYIVVQMFLRYSWKRGKKPLQLRRNFIELLQAFEATVNVLLDCFFFLFFVDWNIMVLFGLKTNEKRFLIIPYCIGESPNLFLYIGFNSSTYSVYNRTQNPIRTCISSGFIGRTFMNYVFSVIYWFHGYKLCLFSFDCTRCQ